MNNQQNTPQPPIKPVKHKKIKTKKVKKHKFLRFLVKVAVLVLVITGAIKGSNYLAEKEAKKVISNYPFEFSNENNTLGYITDNFKVINQYEKDNKTYKVKWSSNDKCVNIEDNGNVTVTRPSNSSRSVVLTQTYKKLLGKYEIDYEINVIATNVVDINDINVVTVESISNGEYNRDIDAVLDNEGNLNYLMGDFKNTYINSVDDALVLLEAYRKEFNVSDGVVFKLNKINNSKLHTTYWFNVYYNDILLSDKSASVVTNTGNYELVKISINASDINIDNNLNRDINYEEIITNHINSLDLGIDTTEPVILELGSSIENNSYILNYIVVFKNNKAFSVKIKNNEIVEFSSTEYNSQYTPLYATVGCEGVNERGEKLTFTGSFAPSIFGGKTILHDQTRNIHAYKNIGLYEISKAGMNWMYSENDIVGVAGVLTSLVGLVEQAISNNINLEVTSSDGKYTSEDAIAVQAFDNIQDAYDFYLDNFGLVSYNNKGSEIKILTDNSLMEDNAAWNTLYKVMIVNPSDILTYSTGMYKEVLGHEYTHAVFGDKTTGSNEDMGGLNEAYSDIMGMLISPESDWQVCDNKYSRDMTNSKGEVKAKAGDRLVMRDLKNINNDDTIYGYIYPEKYHDENWTGECHAISVMISNIAYKMLESEYFDAKDVADVWYYSLDYGYDGDSTYVTCRKYIIASAEDLGYEDAAIDFIAKCFDEAEIFDPSYIYKTTLNEENIEEASDGTTTLKTTSTAIVGDTLLDDTTQKRYLVFYSPADLVLGECNIYVYEEREGEKWFSHDEITGARLSNMLNEKYPEFNIKGNKFKVDYRTVSPVAMGVAERFCKNSKSMVKNLTLDYISQAGLDAESEAETKEIIDIVFEQLFGFILQWKMTESTPYDMCDNLGLLD